MRAARPTMIFVVTTIIAENRDRVSVMHGGLAGKTFTGIPIEGYVDNVLVVGLTPAMMRAIAWCALPSRL